MESLPENELESSESDTEEEIKDSEFNYGDPTEEELRSVLQEIESLKKKKVKYESDIDVAGEPENESDIDEEPENEPEEEGDDGTEVRLTGYCTAYDPIIQRKVKHRVVYNPDIDTWVAISMVTGNKFIYHSYAELTQGVEEVDEMMEKLARSEIESRENFAHGKVLQSLQQTAKARQYRKERTEELREETKGMPVSKELDEAKMDFLVKQEIERVKQSVLEYQKNYGEDMTDEEKEEIIQMKESANKFAESEGEPPVFEDKKED